MKHFLGAGKAVLEVRKIRGYDTNQDSRNECVHAITLKAAE